MIYCFKCGKPMRITDVPYFNKICDDCAGWSGDFSDDVKHQKRGST